MDLEDEPDQEQGGPFYAETSGSTEGLATQCGVGGQQDTRGRDALSLGTRVQVRLQVAGGSPARPTSDQRGPDVLLHLPEEPMCRFEQGQDVPSLGFKGIVPDNVKLGGEEVGVSGAELVRRRMGAGARGATKDPLQGRAQGCCRRGLASGRTRGGC